MKVKDLVLTYLYTLTLPFKLDTGILHYFYFAYQAINEQYYYPGDKCTLLTINFYSSKLLDCFRSLNVLPVKFLARKKYSCIIQFGRWT